MVAEEPPEKQQKLSSPTLIRGDHPWSLPMDVVGGSLSPMGSPRDGLFPSRKQREFIPDNKKDESYWDRRRRNNEAAKRSREKRRLNDMVLETRVLELVKENSMLRAELNAIREKFGLGPAMLPSPISHSVAPLLPHNPPAPAPNVAPHNEPLQRTVIHQPIPLHHPHLQRAVPSPVAPPPTQAAKLITALSMPKAIHPMYSQPPVVPMCGEDLSAHHETSPLSSGSWASHEDHPTTIQPSAGTAFSLPHKLRHQWHMGSDTAVVPEHRDREDGVSSDGDSGASSSDVPASPPLRANKNRRRVIVTASGDLKTENIQLRSEMQRLAEEVATLRDIMLNPSTGGGNFQSTQGDASPPPTHVTPPPTPAEAEDLRKIGESSPSSSSCGNMSGSEH